MTENAFASRNERLRLKESSGWFPAGRSFRKALGCLSDGAFKLFTYLCLQADRTTGRLQVTHQQLAAALGKSKRAIGSYVVELQDQGTCAVSAGKNQYAGSCFQISDDYWPYHRPPETATADAATTDSQRYVAAIREAFVAMACGCGKFSPADVRTSKALERRGVPLAVVLDAMLVGSSRKYLSWLNGGIPEAIGSLAYFLPLIAEVQQQPLADDYRRYVRSKNEELARGWDQAFQVRKQSPKRGYPDMPGPEIVQ
jgi:hypothetical protein